LSKRDNTTREAAPKESRLGTLRFRVPTGSVEGAEVDQAISAEISLRQVLGNDLLRSTHKDSKRIAKELSESLSLSATPSDV
jgi:hypothetical protein